MKLRFLVPLSIELVAHSKEQLDLGATFTYKNCQVNVELPDGEISESLGLGDGYSFWRKPKGILVTVTDDRPESNGVQRLIDTAERKNLLSFMQGLTTKILRIIRNIGNVYGLPETISDLGTLKYRLLRWHPEASGKDGGWTALDLSDLPGPTPFEAFSSACLKTTNLFRIHLC